MTKHIRTCILIVLLFIALPKQSLVANAASFNKKIYEIQKEINRDNLNEAIKKIKKISINNENQQEQINILFGDIYLKVNQPKKAEEFYQKSFFTSNQDIVELNYPVSIKPEKIKSLNFDKTPEIQGQLNGIKGQYLFLNDEFVLNIRKFTGYILNCRV